MTSSTHSFHRCVPIKKIMLLCLVLLSFPYLALGQGSSEANFTVGVAGNAPFVSGANSESGISLEIWKELAIELGVNFKLISFESISKALEAAEKRKIDAVIGPVSITSERAKSIVFSQPYFRSSLSIMSRVQEPSLWDRIKPFFNTKFLIALCTFVFILALVGLLFWLAERKKNSDEFSQEPLKGIGDGMWCAIVTMTTTGYGDIAPRSLMGRIVAGSWMIICIVFAASMVAGITSTLAFSSMGDTTIDTASEISGKRVAVIADSPAERFVNQYGGITIEIDSLQKAYKILENKDVAAVVNERLQLRYYLRHHANETITISPHKYEPQSYGVALSGDNNNLLKELNVALLKLKESGRVNEIVEDWLGNKQAME